MRGSATEHDLLGTPADGIYELVDGQIRRTTGGCRHATTSMALAVSLARFVWDRRLGHVFGANTGHRMPNGNVRCPDVSFVSFQRFPQGAMSDDFVNAAPDLAVEVVSPNDRPRWILDRVGEYLEAGVRLVWIIDPQEKRGVVYRPPFEARAIGAEDDLVGEDVVPDFRCRLGEIFE